MQFVHCTEIHTLGKISQAGLHPSKDRNTMFLYTGAIVRHELKGYVKRVGTSLEFLHSMWVLL